MLRILYFLTVLCCCGLALHAQDTPIKHWTFDKTDGEFAAAMASMVKPNYADGIEKFGIYLDGKNHYFTLRGVELSDDFTVSFWFMPTNVEQTQTIFLQEKVAKKTDKTERYLHLFIQNKKLYLKNEKTYLSIQPLELKDSEWYFITYSYDGFEAKIMFGDEVAYSTGKVTLYNKMAQRDDFLHIGKNFGTATRLEAILDEVKFYNRPIKEKQIKEEYAIKPIPVEELPPVAKADTPGIKKVNPTAKIEDPLNIQPEKPTKPSKPKIKDEYAKDEFKGRTNDVQHQIVVISPNIEVEVWDYDEFDKDRISITLNNSPFIGTATQNRVVYKKRKREKYKFNLKPEQVNYLTFIAEDMGIYDSQNTAAVRVIVDGKRYDDVYKLVLTKEKNAVLKIIHMPVNPDKKPIVPIVPKKTDDLFAVVVDNNILSPLVVDNSDVKIKIKGKQADNRKIKVTMDSKDVVKPFAINNKVSRNIKFNIGIKQEKILLIEAQELKQGENCTVQLDVYKGNKVMKTYTLQLDKTNTLLPLVYVPSVDAKRPRNQRVITVSDTSLLFKIKDNSKVDGDVIAISQDGKKILSDYLLTSDFKDLKVSLKANRENNFIFIPVSMGRSKGENTAYIQIIANGEIIHQFSLSSQDQNKPAKLIILHSNE
jgi:hypothetical protein